MQINIYSFLLPTIAGLATLLGTVLIFINFKHKDNIIVSTLSFASGVMLTISFSDLLPSSIKLITKYFKIIPGVLIVLIFFSLGNLITFNIHKRLIEKGSNSLYKVGIISMIAIILHNIPDGLI